MFSGAAWQSPELDGRLGWACARMGNRAKALESLGRAIEYGSELIIHAEFGGLRTDCAWDGMREDPRFEELCRRVGMGQGQWPK